jgi:hypothetical protein
MHRSYCRLGIKSWANGKGGKKKKMLKLMRLVLEVLDSIASISSVFVKVSDLSKSYELSTLCCFSSTRSDLQEFFMSSLLYHVATTNDHT